MNPDDTAGIYRTLFGARDQVAAGRTTEGVSDLLRQGTSGLTEGERRFESQRLRGDDAFNRDRRSYLDAAQAGISGLRGAEAKALAVGQRREEEETGIRDQSREFAADWAEGISGDIQSSVDAANASDEDLANRFSVFRENGGSREDLEALGVDSSGFNTEHAQGRAVADAKFNEIMAKPEYEAIRDIPRMEVYIHSNGRENYRFPDVWFMTNRYKYTKPELASIQKLARQRERELDAFFRPGVRTDYAAGNLANVYADQTGEQGLPRMEDMQGGGSFMDKAERRSETKLPSREQAEMDLAEYGYIGDVQNKDLGSPALSAYKPSRFGEGMPSMEQFNDLTPFVSLQQGDQATRENMATEYQKNSFNRAKSLLDEADRIGESDPRRAAEIKTEVDRYVAEEQAVYDEIVQGMFSQGRSFNEAVNGARARREAKRRDARTKQIIAGAASAAAVAAIVISAYYTGGSTLNALPWATGLASGIGGGSSGVATTALSE